MNLSFEVIENSVEKYKIYMTSLKWDTDKTYSIYDNEYPMSWIFEKVVSVHLDDELVGIGGIKPCFENNEMYVELSSIVNPEYRRMGIADRLLNFMLEYTKNELNIPIAKVNILKSNIPSIKQIENNNFTFIYSTDNIITYEKKLINKQ